MADFQRSQAAGSHAIGRSIIYTLLILFALYYLMPLFVMISTSLMTLDDIRGGNLVSWPVEITFEAWAKAWSGACTGVECDGPKGNFWNSVSFVVPAVLISTLIGALNGYVLTMWRFRGSDLFFTVLLLGCFIPFQVVLLPMAQTLGYLGIANSIAGLIFVHVVYGLAFTAGLEMRRVPKDKQEKIVERVAKILQMGPLLDRKPSQLSGGQRQRVAMGRAIARDPQLFLFDEPLSNLDAKLRVEMRTEIKLLHDRLKATIVYVTHDQCAAGESMELAFDLSKAVFFDPDSGKRIG